MLAIKVLPKELQPDQQINPEAHLKLAVEGTLIEFNGENLKQTADLKQIRKLYKLDVPVPSKAGKTKPKKGGENNDYAAAVQVNGFDYEVDKVREMEAVIIGIMALKGS